MSCHACVVSRADEQRLKSETCDCRVCPLHMQSADGHEHTPASLYNVQPHDELVGLGLSMEISATCRGAPERCLPGTQAGEGQETL